MTYLCCGGEIPETCGFHPEGDDCMCYGTICGLCLGKKLGFDQ